MEAIVFALARSDRSFAADVLVFEGTKISLRKRGKVVREWSPGEVLSLRYQQGNRGAGMWQMLGGALLGRQESTFRIHTESEKIEVRLELDATFRKQELRRLFGQLYREGVDLRETNAQGRSLFLLQPLPPEQIRERIAALRT